MRQSSLPNPVNKARAVPSGRVFSPVQSFFTAALFGALLLAVLFTLLFGAAFQHPFALASGVTLYLAFAALAGFRLRLSYPHRSLGLCNLVTLSRLAIAGILISVVLSGIAPNWASFCLAALALSLDGVDGWLARRQALVSDFGARFDVEVDALLALILAIYAATNGTAGPWVILLALPHYAFWIARVNLDWLDQPLRPSFARKAVCVFQIGTLIALQLPWASQTRFDIMVAAVGLALLWSFGRDILWLWRSRRIVS